MATSYDTESAENQALIDSWANNQRAQLGEFGRILGQLQALDAQYTNEIAPLLALWNATEQVPNKSGLAGSSPSEQHEQMETWQSYVQSTITELNTAGRYDEYVSAAGPTNVA